MTPEERAKKAGDSLLFWNDVVERELAAAIRAAVEAEREACAKLCEAKADDDSNWCRGVLWAAAAIRGRELGPSGVRPRVQGLRSQGKRALTRTG